MTWAFFTLFAFMVAAVVTLWVQGRKSRFEAVTRRHEVVRLSEQLNDQTTKMAQGYLRVDRLLQDAQQEIMEINELMEKYPSPALARERLNRLSRDLCLAKACEDQNAGIVSGQIATEKTPVFRGRGARRLSGPMVGVPRSEKFDEPDGEAGGT